MEDRTIGIGSTKIRLSNIESYDMTTEKTHRKWIEKKKRNLFLRILLAIASPGTPLLSKEIQKSEIRSYDVLLIKTLQGGDYRFSEYEYDFDAHEKKRELDEYFHSE